MSVCLSDDISVHLWNFSFLSVTASCSISSCYIIQLFLSKLANTTHQVILYCLVLSKLKITELLKPHTV